jgi:hypothetical protein
VDFGLDDFSYFFHFFRLKKFWTPLPQSFVDQTTSYMLYALHAVSYVLIPLTAWRMFSFVRNNAAYNGRLKALNRQLTFNLIVLVSEWKCLKPLFKYGGRRSLVVKLPHIRCGGRRFDSLPPAFNSGRCVVQCSLFTQCVSLHLYSLFLHQQLAPKAW